MTSLRWKQRHSSSITIRWQARVQLDRHEKIRGESFRQVSSCSVQTQRRTQETIMIIHFRQDTGTRSIITESDEWSYALSVKNRSRKSRSTQSYRQTHDDWSLTRRTSDEISLSSVHLHLLICQQRVEVVIRTIRDTCLWMIRHVALCFSLTFSPPCLMRGIKKEEDRHD